MSINELQRVVLRLANQTPTRYFLWLNHPQDPQLMGIQFASKAQHSRQRYTRTCDCGTCKKCKHREYVRVNRVVNDQTRLRDELRAMGFEWSEPFAMWTISKTEPAQGEKGAA